MTKTSVAAQEVRTEQSAVMSTQVVVDTRNNELLVPPVFTETQRHLFPDAHQQKDSNSEASEQAQQPSTAEATSAVPLSTKTLETVQHVTRIELDPDPDLEDPNNGSAEAFAAPQTETHTTPQDIPTATNERGLTQEAAPEPHTESVADIEHPLPTAERDNTKHVKDTPASDANYVLEPVDTLHHEDIQDAADTLDTRIEADAITELGLPRHAESDRRIVGVEVEDNAPPLVPASLSEIFDAMDAERLTHDSAEKAKDYQTIVTAEVTEVSTSVIESAPTPAQKVTTVLAERITLLEEDEAIIATARLQTILALAEQIHEVAELDEVQATALTEELRVICSELLEQLAIQYDEETLRKLVTKLLDQEPEPLEASEQLDGNLLQKYMREITGGNPSGLVFGLSQRVKAAIKHRVGIGRLAVARSATAV